MSVNGTLLLLKIDTVLVTAETDSNMNFTVDMLDITTKASTGKWKEFIPGEKTGTVSVTALYDSTDAEGFTQAFADMDNGTSLAIQWGEVTTGEKFYTATGYISNLSVSGPKNEPASYSFDAQITGQPAEDSVT